MVQRRETDSTNQVVVVGAGVAGVLIARALAERDLAVTVVDPALPAAAHEPARQGALYVKPAVDYSPETQFAHLAFLHAADFYSRLQAQHPTHAFWHQTGTLQLAWNERERKRQEKLIARNDYGPDFLRAVSAGTASKLSGIDLLQGGLWFPRGGHLLHSGLRCAALDHPRIRCVHARITGKPSRSTPDGRWSLRLDSGPTLCADAVALALGASTADWFPELPLGRIRGQITRISATEPPLKATISGGGYVLPPLNGAQCIGATFDRDCGDTAVRDDSHRQNLDSLNNWLPEVGTRLHDSDIRDGWVGFRSTTPDHMPMAGHRDGLHLIAGLGGKGLAYAPLLAQEIANAITGQPPTLDPSLQGRVSPARFL